MTSRIVPLVEVSSDLLLDFLLRTGMSREIAQWRYLDPAFNRGRNRGFAWVPHQRIEGMIGLIPFRITGDGATREANWSSDWMLADPSRNPGMGIVLLKRAIQASQTLFALGGNETTQRLLPRIATRTAPGAGVALHLLLRSGAILRRIERRAAIRRLPIPRALYMIPLRRLSGSGAVGAVTTETGVATVVGPLIEAERGEGWSPQYDFEYVDWQIGRAPVLDCWTSYGPARGEPRAAALYWRPRASADFWRLALWSAPHSPDAMAAVLREALFRVSRSGGMAVSTIVSRLDADRLALLRSAGFIAIGRRALYQCNRSDGGTPAPELSRLSYLDTDLAYRF